MTTDPTKLNFLESCRIIKGPASLVSDSSCGTNGAFLIPFSAVDGKLYRLLCIASHEGDWEHVSVTDQSTKRSQERTPSWEMMTRIKRAFWDDEECVVEFHVPMVEWINEQPGCLHLWKKTGNEFPRPAALFVGTLDESPV